MILLQFLNLKKKIKNLCYTIKDEILRKYILEEFLVKIKDLTPMQSIQKNFNRYKNKNFKVLQETRILHDQSGNYTKQNLKEFSILYMMINCSSAAKFVIEDLADLKFSTYENENLKNDLIKQLVDNDDKDKENLLIKGEFEDLNNLIKKNSSIKNILFKKDENEKKELLIELIKDLKEIDHMKKIESLENKVAKNLDENLYSELMKLKSQLNRE